METENLPPNPRKIAVGKSEVTFMSCWMVGKAGAPPNENSIVPNDRAKLVRSISVCCTSAGLGAVGWVKEAAIKIAHATPVAADAPIAIGLEENETSCQ